MVADIVFDGFLQKMKEGVKSDKQLKQKLAEVKHALNYLMN